MRILFSLLLIVTTFNFASAKDFNIEDYGAVGDDKTISTEGVQKAIDACTKNGGGRVVVPGGRTYIIGTIYLKSNVYG